MSPRRAIVRLPNRLSGSRFVLASGFAIPDTTGARARLIGVAADDTVALWRARTP